MTKPALTHKREAFARLYVEHGDASKAYREAFPSSQKWADDAVWQNASKLLKDTKVLPRVEELRKKRALLLDISDARVIAEIAAIAFSDIGQLEGDDGNFRGLRQLDAATRRAVKSVKYKRVIEGKGKDVQVSQITEIEMHPKLQALNKICEIKGITAPPAQQRPVEVNINITGAGSA